MGSEAAALVIDRVTHDKIWGKLPGTYRLAVYSNYPHAWLRTTIPGWGGFTIKELRPNRRYHICCRMLDGSDIEHSAWVTTKALVKLPQQEFAVYCTFTKTPKGWRVTGFPNRWHNRHRKVIEKLEPIVALAAVTGQYPDSVTPSVGRADCYHVDYRFIELALA